MRSPLSLIDHLEPRLVLAAPTLTHIDDITLPATGGLVTLTYDTLADAANEADADGDPISFRLFGISGQFFRDGVSAGPSVTLTPTGPTSTVDVKIGSTFPDAGVVAFDGSSQSSPPLLLPLSAQTNQPPVSVSPTAKGFAVSNPRTAYTLTTAFVLSALGATDPDNDSIGFRITGDPLGILPATPPLPLVLGDPNFFPTAVSTINLTTTELPLGEVDLLTGVLVDDRGGQSGPVTLRVTITNRPVLANPAFPALGPVSTGGTITITYAQIIDLAGITADPGLDLDLRIISLAPDPGSVQPGVLVSELRKDGVPQLGTFILSEGESVVWFQGNDAPLATTRTIMDVRARTGPDSSHLSDDSIRPKIRIVPTNPAEEGPYSITPGRPIAISADPIADGQLDLVARNDANELIGFFQRDSEDAWARLDLAARAEFPALIGDPVVWDDPKDSARYTYVAGLTAAGLQLLTIDTQTTDPDSVFRIRNLNNEIGGSPLLGGQISSFISTDRRVHIAGRDSNGDVIIFRQTGAGGAGNYAWTAENLSEKYLRAQGQVSPVLIGPIITYVTSWNGLNIAGLTETGEIWSIWTAPPLTVWNSVNLTEVTGAPRLTGGLSAYLTSWSGINITGVDLNGNLSVTWWVPQFGPQWQNSNFTELFGGAVFRPETISSYVTPWGGLNIAGVDSTGALRIYWWEPTRSGTPQDVWTDTTIRSGVKVSNDPASTFAANSAIRAVSTVDTRIILTGVNVDGEAMRIWWRPEFGAEWRDEVL